jgi:hypothetical protein
MLANRIRLAVAVAVALLGLVSATARTFAYNGSAAAAYAEKYAINDNVNYYNFPSDCTNFVSQALLAGGVYQRGMYNYDDTAWWYQEDMYPYSYSTTWAQVIDNYNWLIDYATNPGGSLVGSYYAPPNWANDGLSLGDPIYYDWESDGDVDHMAIQAAYGYDSVNSVYFGNLVDYHTHNYWHIHWELKSRNAQYNTTTIYLVHIQ